MILIDSNIIIGYCNKEDYFHEQAKQILKEIDEGKYGEQIISNFIFSEIVTVLKLRVSNESAITAGTHILNSNVKIKNIDDDAFQEAWNLFKNQKHKLGFTDCSNIALMQEQGIKYIATFDKEFKEVKGIKVID